MKKIFTLIMMVAGLTVFGQQQNTPLVTVTGEGTVKVVPDEVVLQARVEHDGMNASEVKMKNDAVINRVLSYLKSVSRN